MWRVPKKGMAHKRWWVRGLMLHLSATHSWTRPDEASDSDVSAAPDAPDILSTKQVYPLHLPSPAAWKEKHEMHSSPIPKTLFFPGRKREMTRGVDDTGCRCIKELVTPSCFSTGLNALWFLDQWEIPGSGGLDLFSTLLLSSLSNFFLGCCHWSWKPS